MSSANQFHLFRAARDTTRNVHLDWLVRYTRSGMAEGFKTAADRVVGACSEDSWHTDIYFYPIAYLYPHYLELQLKNLLLCGRALIRGEDFGEKAWGHDLKPLWKSVRSIITKVWPEGDPGELKI